MKTIERIYITKGDNIFNFDGVRADKAWAIVIDGKVYWADSSFDTTEVLGFRLERIGVVIEPRKSGAIDFGQWVNKPDGGRKAVIDKRVTKISKHHDDVFNETSSYMKRAVKNSNGSYFWNPNDLWDLIYSEEDSDTKIA